MDREEVSLWQLLELSGRAQNVRELFETGTMPRSVVDGWVSLGEIRRSREGEQLVLEGEVRVSVLYLDEEESPQVFQKNLNVSCRLDAPAGDGNRALSRPVQRRRGTGDSARRRRPDCRI